MADSDRLRGRFGLFGTNLVADHRRSIIIAIFFPNPALFKRIFSACERSRPLRQGPSAPTRLSASPNEWIGFADPASSLRFHCVSPFRVHRAFLFQHFGSPFLEAQFSPRHLYKFRFAILAASDRRVHGDSSLDQSGPTFYGCPFGSDRQLSAAVYRMQRLVWVTTRA